MYPGYLAWALAIAADLEYFLGTCIVASSGTGAATAGLANNAASVAAAGFMLMSEAAVRMATENRVFMLVPVGK